MLYFIAVSKLKSTQKENVLSILQQNLRDCLWWNMLDHFSPLKPRPRPSATEGLRPFNDYFMSLN